MSVQSFSRAVAQLALDYDLLRQYLEFINGDRDHFFPTGATEAETLAAIQQYYGDLTAAEVEVLERGDWDEIFEYIKTAGPGRPYEDEEPSGGGP